MRQTIKICIGFILILGLSTCKSLTGSASKEQQIAGVANPDCENVDLTFLFSIDQDKQLGAQVAQQIAADTKQFPVLDSNRYRQAYQYLYSLRDRILNSGKVKHKNDFKWQLRIIQDDKTLNAFCTPGGYIYVYTGLIKYLTTADALAGVMGHEIAHADHRHSIKSQIQNSQLSVLLSVISGNSAAVLQVLANLTSLRFSRCHETEADFYSVVYLSPTTYKCDGAAEFFRQLTAQGKGGGTPVFLSTHPDPGARVEKITSNATAKGCQRTGPSGPDAAYQSFQKMLP